MSIHPEQDKAIILHLLVILPKNWCTNIFSQLFCITNKVQSLFWNVCSCSSVCTWRKEVNVLFNDALNTFYLRLYGFTHMVKDHSDSEREETRCRHMGYSFRLAAKVLLYASSHRQDNTYHGLCYTSRGALAGMRNSSMGPPWRIDPTTHRTMSECSYQGDTSRTLYMTCY